MAISAAPHTLFAATSNPGKLAEFTQTAHPHGITILPLPNLASIPEPVEDSDTFQGNADIKARAYSLAAPGLLVFADDSGLAVDALDGAPGVRSARYADDLERQQPGNSPEAPGSRPSDPDGSPRHAKGSKDTRNNDALLSELAQLDSPARTGRFVCTLSLARDGEILLRAEGAVAGEILAAPRGNAGFGYDPLFYLPHLGVTMAELAPVQKWELSHRGNAFRALLSQLRGTELHDIAQIAR